MPILDIDMAYGPNEFAMRKDIAAQAVETLKAADLEGIESFDNGRIPVR
jgi:hypothetical protein